MKKISFLLILFLVVFTISSCGKKNENTSGTNQDYQINAYDKIDGKLDNPGMGWVMLEEPNAGGHMDLGSSGEFPEVDNVSLSTSWLAVEYEEGVFDFSNYDQTIDYWTSIGKHINLRISTDNLVLTYTYKACPDWLFDKYNVNSVMVDYTDPGPVTTCRVTDVTDPNYLFFLNRFLSKVNEHYKDNPMVDVVEIRGFGTWGEWHHGWSFDTKPERMAALDTILNTWVEAFAESGKLMVVSSAWDPDYTTTNEYYTDALGDPEDAYMNYVNWSSFDTAWRTPGLTFRRDSGGALLRYDLDERMLYEAYRSGKRVPILGEYATNFANLTTPNNAFDLITGTDDILYKMHANYSTVLGWVAVDLASTIGQGYTEYIDHFNVKAGYRLAVDYSIMPKKIKAGNTMEVMTCWSNTGTGIFPYKTDLTFYLLDSNGNIKATINDNRFDARTFIMSEVNNFYSEIKLPDDLATGTYDLAVAINYQNKKIALGMAGETSNNTRMYKLGTINVDSSTTNGHFVTKTTYANIDSFNFKKNTTYQLTFRYLPKFNMANFYFGNDDCYEFYLESASCNNDSVDKQVGNYKWQDISGEVGEKTVTFTTGNYSDYKMKIVSHNFDNIEVGEVWIKEVSAKSENFESYDMTDASTIIEPINIVVAGTNESAFDGRAFSMYSRNTKAKHILSKIDTKNYSFKKGHSYNVSFDFKADGQVGNGGYFFVAAGEYKNVNKTFDIICDWYDRDDTYVTRKSLTFTPEVDGQTIAFGVNINGSYTIDNLTIVDLGAVGYTDGSDKGFNHNVIPTHNCGFGIPESFEANSFQATGFEWGQFAWGRMTSNPNEVVNYEKGSNEISLLCRIESEAYNPDIDNVWFEFVRTKLNNFNFEPNCYYEIKFDYKVLKGFSSGKVFCFLRDDTVENRFAEAVNNPFGLSDEAGSITAGITVGQTYTFDKVFKAGNHNNYQFMMCANGLWEVALDNFIITKVTEEDARRINGLN